MWGLALYISIGLVWVLLFYARVVLSIKFIEGRVKLWHYIFTLLFPVLPYKVYCEEYNVPVLPGILSMLYIAVVLTLANSNFHKLIGVNLSIPMAIVPTILVAVAVLVIMYLLCMIRLLNDLQLHTAVIVFALVCPPLFELITSITLYKELRRKGYI